jgi:hypothetical protein
LAAKKHLCYILFLLHFELHFVPKVNLSKI